MPLVNVDGTALTVFARQSIVLDHEAADPLHIGCVVKTWVHTINQQTTDVATLCNPGGEKPGRRTQGFTAQLHLTQGANGSFNRLQPMADRLVPTTFAILTDGGAPIAVGNIEMSGKLWVPAIPFINGTAIDEPMVVDLTFPLYGAPLYKTSAAIYAGHASPV